MSAEIPYQGPNALNCTPNPNFSYTTTNLSEAMPGPASPLGWSFWGGSSDLSGRAPWHTLGALSKREVVLPADQSDWTVNIFYGRAAIAVNHYCEMGDRMPGTTGTDLARDAFGFVPPGFVSHPTKRRYPIVAIKQPIAFLRLPSIVAALRRDTEAWWQDSIRQVPSLDPAAARALLTEAKRRFEQALILQSTVIISGIQPTFTAVMKLAVKAGTDPMELMRGLGSHEEGEMIEDLWAVSRDRMTVPDFLARHGYYGPGTGEVSAHSWREDPKPLDAVIAGYRAMGDDEDPARGVRERAAERAEVVQKLLAGLSGKDLLLAKLVLKQAGKYLPLRSVAKVSFTQSLDVGRAAARHIGAQLVADAKLDDAEDIFYLTLAEIQGLLPDNAKALVIERRAIREAYRDVEVPVIFHGAPEVTLAAPTDAAEGTLAGVGVSPGVVEGRVRIVTDPAETEMDNGEILVTTTTDPAWASVMFLADALIVDIGGMLSHAAVFAREIGIPCVMNTGNATRALRDGDLVRVDGAAGTVEVLERHMQSTTEGAPS